MMNIYKSRYSFIKGKLYEFGKNIKQMEYTDEYWKKMYFNLMKSPKENPWTLLISKYLYRCCDEEERRFIFLYFFQKRKLSNVSIKCSLSERACQEWREEILKNIIGIGLQQQLLYIQI